MREIGAHRGWGGRVYRAEEQRGEKNQREQVWRSTWSSVEIWSFHACQKVFKISETNAPKFRGSSPHNSVRVRNSFICTKVESCTRVYAKLLQLCPTLCNPEDCRCPLCLCPWEISRQECWSGLPCPLPGRVSSLGGKLRESWVINRILRRVFPKQWCKI